MATQLGDGFDVGGIRLDRPFKIRRLGHFGFNSRNMNAAMHFYRDLLGFQVTDTLDFGPRKRKTPRISRASAIPRVTSCVMEPTITLSSFSRTMYARLSTTTPPWSTAQP